MKKSLSITLLLISGFQLLLGLATLPGNENRSYFWSKGWYYIYFDINAFLTGIILPVLLIACAIGQFTKRYNFALKAAVRLMTAWLAIVSFGLIVLVGPSFKSYPARALIETAIFFGVPLLWVYFAKKQVQSIKAG